MIISIPVSKKDDFLKKIKSLNKKLVKMEKDILKFEYLNTFIEKVEMCHHIIGNAFRDDLIENVNVEFININIEGMEIFKRDEKNYRFIGSINYADGIKTVKCLENDFISHFENNSTICDHCGTSRKRNGYYLFADDDNNVIRIGSSCAKEYFGINIASYLSSCVKTFFVYGESDYKGSFAFSFESVYSHLENISDGFKNWEKGEMTAKLLNSFETSTPLAKKFEMDYESILNYWNNKVAENDFAINMKEAIAKPFCVERNLGTYAYAIFAAINNSRKENAEKAIRNEMADCKYVDGERAEINGVVTHVSSYTNQYGYRVFSTVYCIEFKGDDNVYYYMATSSKGMCDINTGDKITVKGIVNGRKDFREKKRWVLKSPKLIEHVIA